MFCRCALRRRLLRHGVYLLGALADAAMATTWLHSRAARARLDWRADEMRAISRHFGA